MARWGVTPSSALWPAVFGLLRLRRPSLRRPSLRGRPATAQHSALTYAATMVMGLAVRQAGHPKLIRSPEWASAHTWTGLTDGE